MGLRFKFILQQFLVLATLAGVCSFALLGLLDLRQQVDAATVAHEQLHQSRSVDWFLVQLSETLAAGTTTAPASPPERSERELLYVTISALRRVTAADPSSQSVQYENTMREVREAQELLENAYYGAGDRATVAAAVEGARARMASAIRGWIIVTRAVGSEADVSVREVIWNVTLVALGGLAILVFASFRQYVSLLRPLAAIRDALREFAERKSARPVDIRGDGELVALAHDFNAMADELDHYQRSLEEQVATKSRELVRSERLASVGFLAAGVAHEINNPLGIISGYAELSLRPLRKSTDPAAADAIKSLEIIRDEAFRCKQITSKLLSLAKGSGEARSRLSLAQTAREVAEIVRGLSRFRDRIISVDLVEGAPLEVWANSGEMKQVLLNLIINALEATQPDSGRLWITGRSDHGFVELSVRDNGRGMTPQMLERIFEPFFTERPSAQNDAERGLGLGLSISNAIIESHGGHLRATSGGAGKGSCFTIRLPAATAGTPVPSSAAPAPQVESIEPAATTAAAPGASS